MMIRHEIPFEFFSSNQSLEGTDGTIIIDHWFSNMYKYRREEEDDDEEQSHAEQANENVNNSNEYIFQIPFYDVLSDTFTETQCLIHQITDEFFFSL